MNKLKWLFFITLSFCFLNSYSQFVGPRKLTPVQPNMSEGCVRIADLDNDGFKDVLWSGGWSGSYVGWYKNSCSGFQPSATIDAFSGISTCAIAVDVDNDGLKEVFASFWDNNSFYKYENLSGGVFSSRDTIASYIYQPYLLYASDMDIDGDTDIVCVGTDQVFWYDNDGTGNFIAEHLICTGDYYLGVAAYDFNSDGRMDIVVGKNIYYQQTNGTFVLNATLNGNAKMINVHVIDIDNDGDMDIIGGEFSTNTSDGIKFFINQNGTFTLQASITPLNSLRSSYLGDADGDGDADIMIGKWYSGIIYAENTGNLTFSTHILPSGEAESVVLGDIDNDNDLDLVYANDSYSRFFANTSIFEGDSVIALTLCPGDSVYAQGGYQHITGVYSDTLTAANGCDSIIITNLVHETNTINYSICSGDSVYFSGAYHQTQGVYYDSLTAASGCDSITIHNLTVRINSDSTLAVSACDQFTINGQTYVSSGTYTQTINNSTGCDSVITINLIVGYSSDSTINLTACDSLILNGIKYISTGVYTQHLINSNGCDSALTINLIIKNSTISILSFDVCDSLVLNGSIYYNSGTFAQVVTNSQGCDSTINFSVNILSDRINFKKYACESYSLNGNTYTASGIYYQTFVNAHGCDSTLVIDLTITSSSVPVNEELYYDWAYNLQATLVDVTVDGSGNIFIMGSFNNTLDVDPGPGIYNITNVGTNEDLFVLHLDKHSNFIWTKTISGSASITGTKFKTGTNNDLYIVGNYNGIADFDPGVNTHEMYCSTQDIFILKLDSAGNFVWSKSIGSTGSETARYVEVDNNNCVYITGYYNYEADFDPGAGVYNLTGTSNAYLLKLNSDGSFSWAFAIGSTGIDNGTLIKTDFANNVYLVGYYRNTVDFDPGAGVYNITNNGPATHTFILKVNSASDFIWAKSFGGNYTINHGEIDLFDSELLSISGLFKDTVDFDPGAGIINMVSNGNEDGFVLQLDSSGEFVDVETIGNSDYASTFKHKNDIDGSIVTTGNFLNTIDLNSGSLQNNTTSNGSDDYFISKMDLCNNFMWAKSFGGTGIEQPKSFSFGPENEMIIIGTHNSTFDADPGSTVQNLTSSGATYNFIQKLHICRESQSYYSISVCNEIISPSGNEIWNTSGIYTDTLLNSKGCDSVVTVDLHVLNSFNTFSAIACNIYTSPSGNYIWTSTGIYNDTIPNSAGCDSIITIDLTIDTVDVSVTVNDPLITSNETGATYQWLDCDNGFSAILNETNQSFSSVLNGNFAVSVTKNNCTDTSDCVAISAVGLVFSDFETAVNLFPNPAKGDFNVDLGTEYESTRVVITDLNGIEIQNNVFINNKTLLVPFDFPAGIYIVTIKSDNRTAKFRVVKE